MDFHQQLLQGIHNRQPRDIARAISIVENNLPGAGAILSSLDSDRVNQATILGVTGSPGVGKSTLTGALISFYRSQGKRVGIIAVDPSSPLTGGALLGDRIRMMGHALDRDVVVRSMATRGRLGGLCASAGAAVRILAASGCSPVIIETVGVGQSEMDIVRLADLTMMVMAPGMGDEIQAMKAGLLEVADILVVNKIDYPGAETLTMELESAVRENGRQNKRICQTRAIDNRGIEELAGAVDELDMQFRQNGERDRRKQVSLERETIEWCIDFLRPFLTDKLRKEQKNVSSDPRSVAQSLIKNLL